MSTLHVGFIGLGALGKGLCHNLIRKGFQVKVHDLNPHNAETLIESGAQFCDSIAQVCAGSNVIITALPSPQASRTVIEGEGGVFQHLARDGIWIEMSTTDKQDLQRLATLAEQRGLAVLECPVTGGVHLANSGEITILVGGEQKFFEKANPLLEAMGKEIIYLGKLGNASVVKVVTNMLAFIHLIAAGEAMMIPAKYGVDIDATYRAIRASSGNSFVHETESKLILSGSYNVKFNIDLACKDLGLVNDIAKELNVPLELGAHAQAIYHKAREVLGGQAQSPEVVSLLEQTCGLKLRADGYPQTL